MNYQIEVKVSVEFFISPATEIFHLTLVILTLILMKAKCKLSSAILEQLELPVFINMKYCSITRCRLQEVTRVYSWCWCEFWQLCVNATWVSGLSRTPGETAVWLFSQFPILPLSPENETNHPALHVHPFLILLFVPGCTEKWVPVPSQNLIRPSWFSRAFLGPCRVWNGSWVLGCGAVGWDLLLTEGSNSWVCCSRNCWEEILLRIRKILLPNSSQLVLNPPNAATL